MLTRNMKILIGIAIAAIALYIFHIKRTHAEYNVERAGGVMERLEARTARNIAIRFANGSYTVNHIAALTKPAIQAICKQYFLVYDNTISNSISDLIDNDYGFTVGELYEYEKIPYMYQMHQWSTELGGFDTRLTTSPVQNWSGMHIQSLDGLVRIPELANVERLDLSDNKIVYIDSPENVFALMPQLQSLRLRGNPLSQETKNAVIRAARGQVRLTGVQ